MSEKLQALARELAADKDPDYKDGWERGFDAGQQDAGRRLLRALEAE